MHLKIPPVVVMLFFGLSMWFVNKYLDMPLSVPGHYWIAIFFLFLSFFFGITPLIQFAKQKTTVHPHKPDKTSSLVKTGIYRLSRNPMYLALLLVLISYSFYLDNIITLAATPLFIIYMNKYQIIPEEQILVKKFGDEYKKYTSTVRRWL